MIYIIAFHLFFHFIENNPSNCSAPGLVVSKCHWTSMPGCCNGVEIEVCFFSNVCKCMDLNLNPSPAMHLYNNRTGEIGTYIFQSCNSRLLIWLKFHYNCFWSNTTTKTTGWIYSNTSNNLGNPILPTKRNRKHQVLNHQYPHSPHTSWRFILCGFPVMFLGFLRLCD